MFGCLRQKLAFGGELSGHFYFRDSFNTDSGAVAFACLLTILSKQDRPLSELMKPYQRYAQSGEINTAFILDVLLALLALVSRGKL